jgi:hypothetical protein
MNRVLLIDYAFAADDLNAAVAVAAESIAIDGVRVIRLEPDDLVSLQDIGHESGLGWSRIHALANQDSVDAMPLPVRRLSSDRPLWSWREVSAWLAKRKLVSEEVAKFAAEAFEINKNLSARLKSF